MGSFESRQVQTRLRKKIKREIEEAPRSITGRFFAHSRPSPPPPQNVSLPIVRIDRVFQGFELVSSA